MVGKNIPFGSEICYAVIWKDAEERGRSYGDLVLTWVSRNIVGAEEQNFARPDNGSWCISLS